MPFAHSSEQLRPRHLVAQKHRHEVQSAGGVRRRIRAADGADSADRAVAAAARQR